MIQGYREFKDLLDKGEVIISNKRFERTLKNFSFHQIQKKAIYDEQMIQKINKSKVIIIDTCISMGNVYNIICYERELVITDHSHQSLFKTIFSRNNEDKVYFVPKIFPKCHKYSNFMEEISNFKEHFQINSKCGKAVLKFWKIILPCISAFLIKKGYIDNSKDRFHGYCENTKSNEIYKNNEFIYLRAISSTSLSTVYLCYHIESEKILAIKKLHDSTDKLESREIKNYKCINYPFIPKFFGTIPSDYGISLVIEFINGNTLTKLHKNNLSFEQKLKNIFELLYTFRCLHQIHFIYRDLKPNNIMLDENQHIVLIDFDRMIDENDKSSTTMDFYTPYIDPKIIEGLITTQNDIYSIGKILYNIFNKKEIHDYPIINQFYEQCLFKKSI